MLAACLGTLPLTAQEWDISGNIGNDPQDNYVGNNDNVPLNFRTDSLFRMRLYDTKEATINGFSNIIQNGFLGITTQEQFYTGSVGPFSRIHLVDSALNSTLVYAQDFGYRPWMRNGITMTGNADQCYFGHKYKGTDTSDVVI